MRRGLTFNSKQPVRPFNQLLNDVEFDLCNAAANHPERLGGRIRDVDDASGNERTAVIDPNCHGAPSRDICHPQPGAEWQCAMSGGQFVGIEFFAARGPGSFFVEAGKSVRRNLCFGCIFVRRERGMLSRTATRLWVGNDVSRLRSSDACRLPAISSDLLVTTEDCAQAASEAAARAAANSRTIFRTPNGRDEKVRRGEYAWL